MSASRGRRTRVVLDLAHRQQESACSLVVIKIGGSLLGRPELIERIEWLLDQRPDSRCLLVSGGGEAANLVRQWQRTYDFSDEAAHWLALRAMTLNEALLSSALPNNVLIADADQMSTAWEQNLRPILACESFLREHEPASADGLPHDWDVTSDSIAAWCARQLNADELILAKSVDIDAGMTAAKAVERGFVDAGLPSLLDGIVLSWTNLRAPAPEISHWL